MHPDQAWLVTVRLACCANCRGQKAHVLMYWAASQPLLSSKGSVSLCHGGPIATLTLASRGHHKAGMRGWGSAEPAQLQDLDSEGLLAPPTGRVDRAWRC